MVRFWAGLVVGLMLATGAGHAAAAEREVLPSTVVPLRYDLHLKPDLKALAFAGDEAVQVQVSAPVREMVLNAEDLVFDRVSVVGGPAGHVTLDA